MDLFVNSLFWVIAGSALVVAELIIPGGIVVFLGIACLMVAGALWLGFISTWVGSLTLFFIASLTLILLLRSLLSGFFEGDSSVANTDESLDEVNQIVRVIETIGPGHQAGVVAFRGTHWRALTHDVVIEAGSQAKIVSRENTTMIVQPELESSDELMRTTR